MYLDPGVLVAPASVDAARLVCRLLLWLWSRPPAPDARAAITDGLEEFVANRLAARAVGNPRELIGLILLDAINILSTYISAPATLPLPAVAGSSRSSGEIITIVQRAAGALRGGGDGAAAWRLLTQAARA